jgi:hypothetical protein
VLAGVAQSVQQLATGWMARGWMPVEARFFRTCLEQPRDQSSLLYNGKIISLPGVKRPRRGVDQPCPSSSELNTLNAELNPICHLLILLGDLTLMGPCIVSIFQYISNKMQRYTIYLYLETALRHPQHIQTGSISSTIAADSSNGVTNIRCCRYRCMRSWWWVEVPPETCRAVSRYK